MFTDAESTFLKKYLPAFCTHHSNLLVRAEGLRKVKRIKGCQKEWVLKEVFPLFVKEFGADSPSGPKLDKLREKVCRWYTNHRSKSGAATSTSSPKRPRATNAELVFGEEQKVAISQEVSNRQTSERDKPEFKISEYNSVRRQLFNDLDEDEKRGYIDKAATRNEERRGEPEKSLIFANQNHIIEDVPKVLRSLIGWNWGQYGDAVFFVQGAFRNEHGKLKLFNVSVGPNPTVQLFRNELPDYENDLRKIFKEYAKRELPGTVSYEKPIETPTQTAYVTETLQNEGGHPLRSSVPSEVDLPLVTKSFQDREIVPDFSPDASKDASSAINFSRTNFSVPSPSPISATVGNTTRKGKKRKAVPSGHNYPAAAKKQRIGKVMLPVQGPARMSSRIHNEGYVNKNVTIRKPA